jgi:hypothetical protein
MQQKCYLLIHEAPVRAEDQQAVYITNEPGHLGELLI